MMKTIKTIEKIAIFEKISMIVIVKKMIKKIILMIFLIRIRIVQIVTSIISSNKKHCFHVDFKCRNCKRINHIVKNCRQKKNDRYKKIFNKNFDDSKKFIIFDTHIDMINFNAIELIVERLLSFFSTNI